MAKKNNKWKAHEKIAELENAGYRVEVEHERWTNGQVEQAKAVREERNVIPFKFDDYSEKTISPTGGSTSVEIWRDFHEEETLVVIGQAVCSVYDNFNKKLGIQIALGRALKESDVEL